MDFFQSSLKRKPCLLSSKLKYVTGYTANADCRTIVFVEKGQGRSNVHFWMNNILGVVLFIRLIFRKGNYTKKM